jgi:hypothetical protein
VRWLCSLFFKCKYKERDTLCGVAFDTVACIAATESLLLYYAHRILLSDVFLSYGTRYNAKAWNPFSS